MKRLYWIFLVVIFLFLPAQAQAVTSGEMPVGSIAQMSGMKFVKVTSNCLFIGLEGYGGAKRVAIDYGASTSLVAPTIATGQVCSWEDSNNNLASPHSCTTLVYPTVTTTYQLTVTYGTSSSTYLYQVVVNNPSSNPTTYYLPPAGNQTLTAPTVISNQTCTWNPSTYLSSSTSCAPTITPSYTSIYNLNYTVTLSTGHQFSYLIKGPTFQNTTSSWCSSLSELATFTLMDARDSKTYRIRKFADGHCWMIDNLVYGGSTDACASKTNFSGTGSITASNRFGAGTYGDCRNNPSSTTYGYLYNWQAAMQQSLAYYGYDYTSAAGNGGSGICPSSWQLPPDSGAGSFYNLHTTYNSISGTSSAFWANTAYWNGVYAGLCGSTGDFAYQSSYAYYWSSTQTNTTHVYNLYFGSAGDAGPHNVSDKRHGFPVRCVL